MSYGSEKSFTGKAHNNENKKVHKRWVTVAALILIVAAVAWTTLYTKSLMTKEKINPIENAVNVQADAPAAQSVVK